MKPKNTLISFKNVRLNVKFLLLSYFFFGGGGIYRCLPETHGTDSKWAATWQNQQNDCAPSEDSDQPWHPPSLIRVFAGCTKKAWVLSYPLNAQQRLWSDWADAQADLSLRLRTLILLVFHVVAQILRITVHLNSNEEESCKWTILNPSVA